MDAFDAFSKRLVRPDVPTESTEPELVPEPVTPDKPTEYVHMQLPDGESVRFNRVFAGHRFTDEEVLYLTHGHDVTIDTTHFLGVTGALDWSVYNDHEYYGFIPYDAVAYTRETAPMPRGYNGHTFSTDEQERLRRGETLTIVQHSRKLAPYGLRITFRITDYQGVSAWRIFGHYADFERTDATVRDCAFLPVFGGRTLTHDEIALLRSGKSVSHYGTGRTGRPYRCRLTLGRDPKHQTWWKLIPRFR